MPGSPIAVAEDIFDALKGDVTLPNIPTAVLPAFPAVDMSIFVEQASITVEDLTEGKTNGSGVFDKLMTSVTAHLDRERQAGRISNNDFAKSYVDFSSAAMASAIQFLLSKDQTRWAALSAQTQAKLALVALAKAGVELESAKYQMALMAYQAEAAEAQTALIKVQLAQAQIEFATAEYRLSDILPKEALILTAQKAQVEAQTTQITSTTNTLLPQQVRGATAQADGQIYQTTYLMPTQKVQIEEQNKLVKEQTEAQRAQTLDTRVDGTTPVTGSLGKQKQLYDQQIDSYRRDAQLKAARPFIDAWITLKTIDEGTLPPTGFSNANLDQVLSIIRTDNDLT
jgi:hypothetical protein